MVLVGLGLLNYLPTRHFPAAALMATGQCVLLAEQWDSAWDSPWRISIGLGCLLAAALTVFLRREPVLGDDSLDQRSQRWLHFRNAFGAFWGLRILQRVNETAVLRDWTVHLTWFGFESVSSSQTRRPTESQLAEIDHTLDTLLRRFF